MQKFSKRQKEILAINFTDDQIRKAIKQRNELQEYNDKIMAGKDVKSPGISNEDDTNMTLYFLQQSIKFMIKHNI